MSKNLIYGVHGYLGQASDWDKIVQLFSSKKDVEFHREDLFGPDSEPIVEFEEYTENLSEKIDELLEQKKKKIFIGYSLGGRLGLHLLRQNPEQFDHYVFVSTNPGLLETENSEKNIRLGSDMRWASLIQENNWQQFLTEWNKQSLFESSEVEPQRRLEDFDLIKLKKSLVMWSVSQQDDFRNYLKEYQAKITWVVGEKDSKFLKLSEDLMQKKILLDFKRIFSGHRVCLEKPDEIYKLLNDLL